MTKDEYFQNCMDAWKLGWDSSGPYRPIPKKVEAGQKCLAAFIQQFPESQYVDPVKQKCGFPYA